MGKGKKTKNQKMAKSQPVAQPVEVKWELNTLDDEENKSEESKPTQPVVQQATVPQIKFNIQSKKPQSSRINSKPRLAPTFVEGRNLYIPKPVPTFVNNLRPITLVTNPKLAAPVPTSISNPSLATPVPTSTNNPKLATPVPTSMNITKPAPPAASFVNTAPSLKNPYQHEPKPKQSTVQPPHGYSQKPFRSSAGIPRSFLQSHGEYGAIQPQQVPETPTPKLGAPQPLQLEINAENPGEIRQQYSPSDTYNDTGRVEQDPEDGRESPESDAIRKRLSAFQRLGPQPEHKKPKLTINLMCNNDQSVREVVEPEEIVPVHLRKDIIESTDETVMKYLPFWPWKKGISSRKVVTAKSSKSAMLLEQELMEEIYERDSAFVEVSVKGYPPTWRKEDVLDALLDAVKGKSFIPCFIEFTKEVCKFLVIRSRPALTVIHKLGFYITKEEVQLQVFLHRIDFTLQHLDYLPRLVLRKRLAKGYDSERTLDLKAFTLQPDISHFIYFPLNRAFNQMELVQLQSTVAWDYLTDLDLSHNRLTAIDAFDLPKTTPRLKNLNLSHNCLQRATALLRCRGLSLKTLRLEGNPLCHDYIDPDHYVKVLRMMFPSMMEIDGIPVKLKGDLPTIKQNYCPAEAMEVVDKYLEVFFPLLDLPGEDRAMIEDLYDERATLTVTYKYKMRYSPIQRYFRNLFLGARVMADGEMDSIEGASAITKIISKWPSMQHDPLTFTVDVMYHSESSTIFRVGGILKLTVETLAEDEHLVAFTRTLVLISDGAEYKIHNEMLYWEIPCAEYANMAFKLNPVITKRLTLKFESVPDDEVKEKLVEIFMKVTELDRTKSERCLEIKEWNYKHALEYFTKLLKLDDFSCLLEDK